MKMVKSRYSDNISIYEWQNFCISLDAERDAGLLVIPNSNCWNYSDLFLFK